MTGPAPLTPDEEDSIRQRPWMRTSELVVRKLLATLDAERAPRVAADSLELWS